MTSNFHQISTFRVPLSNSLKRSAEVIQSKLSTFNSTLISFKFYFFEVFLNSFQTIPVEKKYRILDNALKELYQTDLQGYSTKVIE